MRHISMSALVARINRRLAPTGGRLRKTRGHRAWLNCGDYFVLDIDRNFVLHTDVDPVQLARSLGALRPFEEVEGFGE